MSIRFLPTISEGWWKRTRGLLVASLLSLLLPLFLSFLDVVADVLVVVTIIIGSLELSLALERCFLC